MDHMNSKRNTNKLVFLNKLTSEFVLARYC